MRYSGTTRAPYGWEPAKICMASRRSALLRAPAPPPVWPATYAIPPSPPLARTARFISMKRRWSAITSRRWMRYSGTTRAPYGWEPRKSVWHRGDPRLSRRPPRRRSGPRPTPYHHHHLWRGHGGVQHRVYPRRQRAPGPPAADLGTLPLRLADCRRPGQSDGLSGVYEVDRRIRYPRPLPVR